MQTLPVEYVTNKKAWMQSDLFTKWLTKLDRKFMQAGQRVAVVVDNCPAHPNVQSQLLAIQLVFLPPNTTSVLQPCDQGIIRRLKVHYRHTLMQKSIMAIDNGEEFSVNVLDALWIFHSAWDKVTEQTIANCFSHAGFKLPNTDLEEDIIENQDVTTSLPGGVNFEDYISVDEN